MLTQQIIKKQSTVEILNICKGHNSGTVKDIR
jgi:hypothetical protein